MPSVSLSMVTYAFDVTLSEGVWLEITYIFGLSLCEVTCLFGLSLSEVTHVSGMSLCEISYVFGWSLN